MNAGTSCIVAVLSTLVIGLAPRACPAQSLGGSQALKDNLDLPFNPLAEAESEDEAPELIVFYGQTYEADAVFFCLDRSLSLDDAAWRTLQREVTRVISELSRTAEFGIVFFHTLSTVFPPSGRPAIATASRKEEAIELVRSTRAERGSTCVLEGLRPALEMALRSPRKRRTILFLSDGKATCIGEDLVTYSERALREVRELNAGRVRIDALATGFEIAESFLRDLARQNRGTFRRLSR